MRNERIRRVSRFCVLRSAFCALRSAFAQDSVAGAHQSPEERGKLATEPPNAGLLLACFSLFIAVYLAMFLSAGAVARLAGLQLNLWLGLLSAAVATWLTVRIIDGGHSPIGFFVPVPLAATGALRGCVLALGLIGASDLLIVTSTGMRHSDGEGFPWIDLLVVFVPAAIHEEILFRGYLFQKMRAWRRGAAVIFSASVFALLHASNRGITPLAVVNIGLGGVLLALAWERFGHLWYPIGIHFAWNLFSGPILGYRVSGYPTEESVLRISGGGPYWLTGGSFGIEGSGWMVVTQAVAIGWMWWKNQTKPERE